MILVRAFIIGPNPWRDGDAYLSAAFRLRNGEALYPALTDPEAATVFRYAPWFAWAWIPLSYLPYQAVVILWQAAMLACSVLAVIPAWRAGWPSRAIAIPLIPFLVMASVIGNVQPAMVALLVHTIRARAGPLSIALAASLKVVPLLYVVTYIARRQWRPAIISVSVTFLLWAPAFIAGIEHYPAQIGSTTSLWSFSPLVWFGVVSVVGLAAYVAGRRPGAWLGSSLLVALGTPRFISYDWTFILVGLGQRRRQEPHTSSRRTKD